MSITCEDDWPLATLPGASPRAHSQYAVGVQSACGRPPLGRRLKRCQALCHDAPKSLRRSSLAFPIINAATLRSLYSSLGVIADFGDDAGTGKFLALPVIAPFSR